MPKERGQTNNDMKEPFLEPILRKMRVKKVLPAIRRQPNCELLDVGCGRDCLLLKTVEPFIVRGIGIDFKVQAWENAKIKTLRMTMTDSLPFAAESFDIVTMLAVLEHLSDPLAMVRETERILRGGGRLVLTVPSKIARPVLQFFCYTLKIVSEPEMRDHKRYYDRRELVRLFSQTGMTIERHEYFEMGMNNFCVVRKR
jgi:2-polyprenyl-3-methyl-5-hydroxy-6-metoxy-1,4-benzoquinol methylase